MRFNQKLNNKKMRVAHLDMKLKNKFLNKRKLNKKESTSGRSRRAAEQISGAIAFAIASADLSGRERSKKR